MRPARPCGAAPGCAAPSGAAASGATSARATGRRRPAPGRCAGCSIAPTGSPGSATSPPGCGHRRSRRLVRCAGRMPATTDGPASSPGERRAFVARGRRLRPHRAARLQRRPGCAGVGQRHLSACRAAGFLADRGLRRACLGGSARRPGRGRARVARRRHGRHPAPRPIEIVIPTGIGMIAPKSPAGGEVGAFPAALRGQKGGRDAGDRGQEVPVDG